MELDEEEERKDYVPEIPGSFITGIPGALDTVTLRYSVWCQQDKTSEWVLHEEDKMCTPRVPGVHGKIQSPSHGVYGLLPLRALSRVLYLLSPAALDGVVGPAASKTHALAADHWMNWKTDHAYFYVICRLGLGFFPVYDNCCDSKGANSLCPYYLSASQLATCSSVYEGDLPSGGTYNRSAELTALIDGCSKCGCLGPDMAYHHGDHWFNPPWHTRFVLKLLLKLNADSANHKSTARYGIMLPHWIFS
jgi:hypothetical protein